MTVKRIVANIAAPEPAKVVTFYQALFDLDVLMDLGWIQTLGNEQQAPVQLSLASEGGSGTSVPDLSIEVDDLDLVLERVKKAGIVLEYGPQTEPWGLKRFFIKDPTGKLINVLEHLK